MAALIVNLFYTLAHMHKYRYQILYEPNRFRFEWTLFDTKMAVMKKDQETTINHTKLTITIKQPQSGIGTSRRPRPNGPYRNKRVQLTVSVSGQHKCCFSHRSLVSPLCGLHCDHPNQTVPARVHCHHLR